MKISFKELSHLKQINLPELIKNYGVIEGPHNNGAYSFKCPFHHDTNPSLKVNLKGNKWLWHCFGCGAGGNVVSFVTKYEKISMLEAIEKLSTGLKLHATSFTPKNVGTREPSISAEAQKLLNKVVEYYHVTFLEDKAAMNYLIKRGIRDKNIFETFKIGYANGSLHKTIPAKGEIPELLKQAGILNRWGKEHFAGCVVFPIFDGNGNCVEMYGRRLQAAGCTPQAANSKHLYLKGEHKGVFNYQATKVNQSIILTEGIIDALSIYQAGFRNVIALYGTNGLTSDYIKLFQDNNINQIYLCLDGDEAGRKASKRLKEKFTDLDISSHIIELPDNSDPNEYFNNHEAKDFEILLKRANPANEQKSEITVKQGDENIEVLKDGVFIQYAKRKYYIRGIDHSNHQKLRVNIKAATDKKFHIDTIDLYLSKQRKAFIKEAELLFREEPEIIEHDLNRIIEKIEEYIEGKKADTVKSYVMADKEKAEALKFLKSPNMADQILADLEIAGCAGEEINKLVGYIVAISRKLDDPLSLLILSRSAAGKSILQDSILELVPDEDKLKYTRITGQALFYKGENSLDHKIIAIEEAEGANQAAYSIRTIQSSKLLSVASTIKDPLTGDMKTKEYNVKSRSSLILTTTRHDMDYETMNRFMILSIDETQEQTRIIHKLQREKDTLEGVLMDYDKQEITRKHHNAQRLLKSIKVINPYAKYLTYIDDRLRARRDHKKYLNLIKAITLLHQYQRQIKQIEHRGKTIEYIEVSLEDIALANRIAHEVLGKSIDELPASSRRLLGLIQELVKEKAKNLNKDDNEISFTRRDIREYSKWSDNQIRDHIKILVELEYLLAISGRQGSRFAYQLLYDRTTEEGAKYMVGLMEVEQLKKKLETEGIVKNFVPLDDKFVGKKGKFVPTLSPVRG